MDVSIYGLKSRAVLYNIFDLIDNAVGETLIPGFEKIVEERIQAAQKNGDFDDLPNSG